MTDQDKLRLLINDQAKAEFTDDEIQGFLDTAATLESTVAGVAISGNGNLILAAYLATQSLVVKYSSVETRSVSIGGFQTSIGRSQVRMLEQQAERWYELYLNTPAFAIAEENNSAYNQLQMIRNAILRTLPN
jgi:hypothetical protein